MPTSDIPTHWIPESLGCLLRSGVTSPPSGAELICLCSGRTLLVLRCHSQHSHERHRDLESAWGGVGGGGRQRARPESTSGMNNFHFPHCCLYMVWLATKDRYFNHRTQNPPVKAPGTQHHALPAHDSSSLKPRPIIHRHPRKAQLPFSPAAPVKETRR